MQTIASGTGTDTTSLQSIPFVEGVLYEHRIECAALPELADFASGAENVLTQNGAELVNKWFDGNTIVYQFRMLSPESMAAKGLSPYFVPPVFVITIIVGIFALIALVLVLRWTLGQAVGGAMDLFQIALIGLGVVVVIAAGAYVLRKSKVIGPGPIVKSSDIRKAGASVYRAGSSFARGVGETGRAVHKRIIEEYGD